MFLVLFIIEDTFDKFSFLQEESQESQPPEDLNEMEAIEVELPEEAAEAAVEPVNHLPRGKKPGKWGKKLRKCLCLTVHSAPDPTVASAHTVSTPTSEIDATAGMVFWEEIIYTSRAQ